MKAHTLLYAVVIACCAVPCAAVSCPGPDPAPLTLAHNGSASRLETGTARLTSNTVSQAGSVFIAQPLYIGNFDTTFSFMLHGHDSEFPADGLTFCIQNDPKASRALGSIGGYLGYGVSAFWDTPGITKSVAIEFDDYYNAEFRDLPACHIGIDTQGSVVSHVQVASPIPIAGELVNARVTYDGTMLSVYVWNEGQQPTAPLLSYAVDIPAITGSEVSYVGFAAATATYFQFTDILSWKSGASEIIPSPAPVVARGDQGAEL